jgi:cytochrome b561
MRPQHVPVYNLAASDTRTQFAIQSRILHYPIVMFGPVHLPPILPANPTLYAVLRQSHTILAFLLFATFLAHLGAVLFHTLIVRDRLLDRMALWPIRSRKNKSQS